MDSPARNTRIAEQLKETVLEFIQDIRRGIAQGSAQKVGADFASAYFKVKTDHAVACLVVDYILPEENKINDRQEMFVRTGLTKILAKMMEKPESSIESLLGITTHKLNPQQEAVVWDYMDTMICLASQYKKIV